MSRSPAYSLHDVRALGGNGLKVEDMPRLGAACQRVLSLLSDYRPHSPIEIVNVGGTEGMRRLRELRQAGHEIVGPIEDGEHSGKYQLKPLPDAQKRPTAQLELITSRPRSEDYER